jgi:hypothetical protein
MKTLLAALLLLTATAAVADDYDWKHQVERQQDRARDQSEHRREREQDELDRGWERLERMRDRAARRDRSDCEVRYGKWVCP